MLEIELAAQLLASQWLCSISLIVKFPFSDIYFMWSGLILLGETEHGIDNFHIRTVHLDIISTMYLDDIEVLFIHPTDALVNCLKERY